MEYAKESVNKGKLIQLKGKDLGGNVAVLLTPSLADFAEKSKMPAAETLLGALERTLNAVRFAGVTPKRVLRVYVSAKDNVYFESMTIPWDESERPCIVFALPGQINEEGGYIAELSKEARSAFNGMTPDDHKKMRVLALSRAKEILADKDAPKEARQAALDLLSMDAARRRREEGGK